MTAAVSNTIRESLDKWEQAEGLEETEAAGRTGYSLSMYRAIKNGNRRPQTKRIVGFQETTGLPGSMFYPELRGLV